MATANETTGKREQLQEVAKAHPLLFISVLTIVLLALFMSGILVVVSLL